jgi:predicted GTPase
MIADQGRALLIVINKWDGLDDYQKQEVKRKLEMCFDNGKYFNFFMCGAFATNTCGVN